MTSLLWITTAWLLAHPLHYGLPTNAARIGESRYFYLMATDTILAIWTILYFTKNLDGFSRGWHFPTICSQEIVGACYLIASLLALGYLLKIDYSRSALLDLGLFLSIGFLSIRGIAWKLVKLWSRMGMRRAVIVGSVPVARSLAKKIAKHRETMIEVGFLYLSDEGSSNDSRISKQGMVSVKKMRLSFCNRRSFMN